MTNSSHTLLCAQTPYTVAALTRNNNLSAGRTIIRTGSVDDIIALTTDDLRV
jgi:hypothetical protein